MSIVELLSLQYPFQHCIHLTNIFEEKILMLLHQHQVFLLQNRDFFWFLIRRFPHLFHPLKLLPQWRIHLQDVFKQGKLEFHFQGDLISFLDHFYWLIRKIYLLDEEKNDYKMILRIFETSEVRVCLWVFSSGERQIHFSRTAPNLPFLYLLSVQMISFSDDFYL